MRRNVAAVCLLCAAAPLGAPAFAQRTVRVNARAVAPFTFIDAVQPTPVQRYVDGSRDLLPTELVWRPMCGGDIQNLTTDELRPIAERAFEKAEGALAAPLQASSPAAPAPSGLDIVFALDTSVPAAAIPAIAEVEFVIESQFSDPITVVIDIDFAAMAPNILGGTTNAYVQDSWADVRDALQADMDFNDGIQLYLPAGSQIPVRYDGHSAAVTYENRCFVTIANYQAAVGDAAGVAASMTFNRTFAWDYTPPIIDSGAFDFQSVLAHEVGHALGFASGADFRATDIEMMDIFRFQRSDGVGTDFNPDTFEEFQTTARLVDEDAPTTDDDVNTDLITVEYRMSDGTPNQASHFHNQTPAIGVMDPQFASGETFFPYFYQTSDLMVFDAIGWDRPAANLSCYNAAELACGSYLRFDNRLSSSSPNPILGCGTGAQHAGTLWFSFQAQDRSARISTCGSHFSDSTFAVYGGSCGALVEIACSEDGGCAEDAGLGELCVTGLMPGETYYVQFASRTPSDRGGYQLEIECSCPGGCCSPGGSCTETTRALCEADGGTFLGEQILCADDANANGVNDACEVAAGCVMDAATPDATALPMSRFISFVPGNPGVQTALRIKMLSLEHPDPPNAPTAPPQDFFGWEGDTRWVGPPQQFTDATDPPIDYWAASTSCTPDCRDWGSLGLIYVYGAEILPSAQYEIQAVNCACDDTFEMNFAEGLVVTTGRWADVTEPFSEVGGVPQPNFIDINAVVGKYKGLLTAVFQGQAQLHGNALDPAAFVSFLDISDTVNAYKGFAYPFHGPCPCPSAVACGQTCSLSIDCLQGACVGGECRDECGRCAP